MKSTTIKLNNDISIDLPKLIETRLLVQANSGGGKSYAIRRIIEQAFGKVQIIVLDPEGEFTNLRSKYDFVYIGKDGDAAAESRSATLLATKLLELKASAIVDLYELQPQDRKHFVRLFCEAMVNAPKELWHETLIIIDEAHVFAPEKGESEAMGPVIDLATRGRKRGYCVILATQRLPKLNKDAAAECNNKLIGRASQDIDRKRAAEELGFTSREQILSLRDLDPGEFYTFGPAITREVTKIKVGEVHVTPPPRGSGRSLKTPPPSAAVKKILGELKDLPAEAAQEAKTIAELKAALTSSKRQIAVLERAPRPQEPDPDAIKKLTDKAYGLGVSAGEHKLKELADKLNKLMKTLSDIAASVHPYVHITDIEVRRPKIVLPLSFLGKPTADSAPLKLMRHDDHPLNNPGKGETLVLRAIAQHGPMTREHITVVTGYKRSTRDAYIARLAAKEYIMVMDVISPTAAGLEFLGPHDPLPQGEELVEHYIRTLPQGEARIFKYLVHNGFHSREDISEATEFKRSTRDAYIARLMTRQLLIESEGTIGLNPKIYE